MRFNKPIYLCLQGPSISLLDENIQEFKNRDVLWASLNKFRIIEDNILNKIDRKLDIIYCSSLTRFQEEYTHIKKSNAVLISNHEIASNEKNIKIDIVSSLGYGFSSLFAFLSIISQLECPAIYIFGADGVARESVYFGQEKYINENFKDRTYSIYQDTVIMNKLFWKLIDYWGIKKAKIFNCTPESAITCFEYKNWKNINAE